MMPKGKKFPRLYEENHYSKVIKDVLFPFSHENLFKKEMRLATCHNFRTNKICENDSNKGWYSDITNGIVGNSATLQFAHGNIP